MTQDDIAARVSADNGITLTETEARAVAALAGDLNARVAAGADQRLAFDAAPWSFATLCAEIAAGLKAGRKTGTEAGE
ncbi:hypothetical protein [Xanthobacter oligotrophicus]|uniref:hypothetical protein n=1 Tax=Xanthobacter oligotrophicus TaxID=2607286 RepID=UPI0011F35E46|nr:hypothetical protein [Xanthobacter oligotrophicus]MCG5235894.1 hypothetical protein [Xanthobacter oligotrophicus]